MKGDSLQSVREKNKFDNSSKFLDNGVPIDVNDEEEFRISDIITAENKVYLDMKV
jgi:hypothetical protein